MVSRRRDVYSAAMLRGCVRARRAACCRVPRARTPTQVGGWFGPRLFSDGLAARLHRRRAGPPDARELGRARRSGSRVRSSRGSSPSSSSRSRRRTRTPIGARQCGQRVLDRAARCTCASSCCPASASMPFVLVGGGSPIALSSAQQDVSTPASSATATSAAACASTRPRASRSAFDARLSRRCPASITPVTTRARHRLRRRVPRSATKRAAAAPTRRGHRRRPRRRRHPRRQGQVPRSPRGQGRLRGCGRLPRHRQRPRPRPRHRRQVPERARDLQRLRGRGRLPRHRTAPRSTRSRGTIEGLLYADGETVVRDSALAALEKIAEGARDASVDQDRARSVTPTTARRSSSRRPTATISARCPPICRARAPRR